MVETTNHGHGYRIEPEVLDGDMRPSDLVFALEHLRFSRQDLSVLKIDREVARYLVSALRRDRPRAEIGRVAGGTSEGIGHAAHLPLC
jgi:hypothetical protein